MDEVKALYNAISEMNNEIDDCGNCPFYEGPCNGENRCMIERLVYLLEICLREGVTME